MASSSGSAPDDRTLQRYLLGALTHEETERLDELSIVDDDFVVQLSAVEHDLVDSYVSGELTGENLDRFKSHYLQGNARRAKVEFAEALSPVDPSSRELARSGTHSHLSSVFRTPWLAVAATAILATALYLVVDDLRLRREVGESRAAQATAQTRQRELEEQLNAQRSAANDTGQELARLRESQAAREPQPQAHPPAKPSSVLSFVLLPAMRDAASLTTIRVPRGTDSVALRLRLDVDDFANYGAVLKEVSSDRIVWRSGALRATGRGAGRSLTITLPAKLLEPKGYAVDVTGIQGRGPAESIANFPFRVVIE